MPSGVRVPSAATRGARADGRARATVRRRTGAHWVARSERRAARGIASPCVAGRRQRRARGLLDAPGEPAGIAATAATPTATPQRSPAAVARRPLTPCSAAPGSIWSSRSS